MAYTASDGLPGSIENQNTDPTKPATAVALDVERFGIDWVTILAGTVGSTDYTELSLAPADAIALAHLILNAAQEN